MTSLVYLGKLPKSSQVVNEDLQKLGIFYLKASPSEVHAQIYHTSLIPGYAIYKQSFHAFIRSSELGCPQPCNDPYMGFTSSIIPSFFKDPLVNFGFSSPLHAEVRDHIKREFSATDTIARDKPALQAVLSTDEVRKLVADHSPIQTTAATSTSINIVGYRQLVFLRRLFDTVCRTHQYSGEPSSIHSGGVVGIELDKADTRPSESMETEGESMDESEGPPSENEDDVENAWASFYLAKTAKVTAFNNFTVRHRDFNYVWSTASDIPAEATGTMFPYVFELAKEDPSTPIAVINRFFKGALGDTQDEAEEVFERIKSSWSLLAKTEWGMELAHAFWGLGVAMESGATLRVISSAADKYGGFALVGGGFTMVIGEKRIEASPREILVSDFQKASPHDNALVQIFKKITFRDASKVEEIRRDISSLHDLRDTLKKHGTTENGREEILRMVPYLDFPDDLAPLRPTAHNISRVLLCISSESESDAREFPIHPSMILEPSLLHRLWSSFGRVAPSFLVPGGKQMNLGRAFEVTESSKDGKKTERTVRKIAFILKELPKAILDLETVIRTKDVLNPHGASLIGRGSAGSLIKTVEKEQCDKVLAGLRAVAKVTVAEASSVRKRGNDHGEDDRAIKKNRYDF